MAIEFRDWVVSDELQAYNEGYAAAADEGRVIENTENPYGLQGQLREEWRAGHSAFAWQVQNWLHVTLS